MRRYLCLTAVTVLILLLTHSYSGSSVRIVHFNRSDTAKVAAPLVATTNRSTTLLVERLGTNAQESNQAALVIDHGNGDVETRCVAFDTPQISGYDLLANSGLALEIDFQAGGAAVCQIGETGCPAADCFCRCPGGSDCLYWSYWHQNEGQWVYSQIASNTFQVSDGEVEGWVWGPGSVTEAVPPPLLSFAEICQAGPLAETPDGRNVERSWLPYAIFALMILGLGALLLFGRGLYRGSSE